MKKIIAFLTNKEWNRGGKRKLFSPFFFFIFIFLSIIFFSACGLESYPVLYDPIQISTTDINPLSFKHDTRNNVNPNFITLGYDVIYRIYDDDNLPSDPDPTIIADASTDFTESLISKIISNDWSGMYPYRRLNLVNDDPPGTSTLPIYKLSDPLSESSFNIMIDLTISDSSLYNENIPGTKIYFNRYLGDNVTKDFSEVLASDSDVPLSTDPSNVRVAFFVFTFGLTKEGYSLHGNVIYIGSLSL